MFSEKRITAKKIESKSLKNIKFKATNEVFIINKSKNKCTEQDENFRDCCCIMWYFHYTAQSLIHNLHKHAINNNCYLHIIWDIFKAFSNFIVGPWRSVQLQIATETVWHIFSVFHIWKDMTTDDIRLR